MKAQQMKHESHDHTKHGQSKKNEHEQQGMDHASHDMQKHTQPKQMDHSMHARDASTKHDMHTGHADHGTDHTGHEQMFRVRFWWSLLLSIPVLAYSEMIQMWLGFIPPPFPFSEWIPFIFSVVIFAYGGVPFLQMAVRVALK